jgi:hypothetical protein
MSPADEELARLDGDSVAALRAWADIDRFQLPEVPLDNDDGWSAVGELSAAGGLVGWPPRPEKSPEKQRKVLDTRVMFGCLEVARLERLLDDLFADDERFVQTGVRSPRGTPSAAGGQALTCRGSFRVDQDGGLVADSFSYSPLIDFARYVEHHGGRSVPMTKVISDALTWIDQREATFHQAWDRIAHAGVIGYRAALRVLSRVRVRDDRSRYVTQWIWPDDQPGGQLPAFFRGDLLVAANGPTSVLLRDFMAGRPGGRPAVFEDIESRPALEPLLDPGLVPRSAWPSGYRLRLSQQVALTAILDPTADRVTAVNGPPGTGKTTLLRDLYANQVTRRAAVMSTYQTPSSAFGPKQDLESMNRGHWQLYAPDQGLCGFEMLVASSNNSAVENITKELPATERLSEERRESASYFRSDANVWPVGASEPAKKKRSKPDADGKRTEEDRNYRPGLLPGGQAWGFVAAALGSRDRIGAFEQVVGRYLKDDSEIPHLLRTLREPPVPGEWAAARQRFRTAQAAVDREISTLLWIRRARIDLRTAQRDTLRLGSEVEAADRRLSSATANVVEALEASERYEAAAQAARSRQEEANQGRPGWWARWRNSEKAQEWQRENDALGADLTRLNKEHASWHEQLVERRQTQQAAQASHTEARRAADGAILRVEAIRSQLRSRGAGTEVDPINEEWWRRRGDHRGRADVELATAWISPRLQKLREELFLAAIDVHEKFARSCGAKLRANLRTWMALQSNEIQPAAAQQATLAAWQSFFLLVPLASTTFASVARMLRHVPVSSLGWLIVDEAGQAVPASAVGALARFHRAVVVGDPLQLEPVVTLPRALVDQLMIHHRAPQELAPTRASVQALADAVSRRGTQRGRWISLPLLVHNRCLDPMFTIANEMAYLNQMVQGRQEPPVEAAPMAIPSGWIDVLRTQDERDHYLPRDWQQVQGLLRRLDWAAVPSVAVISPFKRVTRRLMAEIPSEVRSMLPEDRCTDDDLDRAMSSVRVGTVHTFQGREHEVVILVLGGGTPGARQWAAGTPHLLNVAITRARDRLYVIGDRAAWQTVGFARYLDRLPAIEVTSNEHATSTG